MPNSTWTAYLTRSPSPVLYPRPEHPQNNPFRGHNEESQYLRSEQDSTYHLPWPGPSYPDPRNANLPRITSLRDPIEKYPVHEFPEDFRRRDPRYPLGLQCDPAFIRPSTVPPPNTVPYMHTHTNPYRRSLHSPPVHQQDNKRFRCDKCLCYFSTPTNLNRHKSSSNKCGEGGNFECSMCSKTYNRKDNLDKHIKKEHKEEYGYHNAVGNLPMAYNTDYCYANIPSL